MENYQHTIIVALRPDQVFNAITHEMSNWWTEMTSEINKVGDKTTASFEDGTTWSFEATRIKEDNLIELRCYQANHIHPVTTPEMRTEWENTILRFEIVPQGKNTKIQFTHIGLTPDSHCYSICQTGWDHFFGSSFYTYLSNKQF